MKSTRQTIRTEDYILFESKSTPGNFYIVMENEKGEQVNVMVQKSIAARWEELDSVGIGERHFTQRRNEQGELVAEPWSRLEIFEIKDSIASANKQARKFQAKTIVLKAASEYNTARKAALEADELSPELKTELEGMLKF
jgi:hypothetical protein